jgi:tol-pal system protein YbgF
MDMQKPSFNAQTLSSLKKTFIIFVLFLVTKTNLIYANIDSAVTIEEALSENSIFEVEQQPNQAINNSDDELRFSGFEGELRNLVGRVERLEHIITQLKDQLTSIEDNIASLSTGKEVKITPKSTPDKITDIPKSADTAELSGNDQERIDYDKALSDLKDNKFQEAELKFDLFIKKYPNSKLLGNAYFWYGETFFRRNHFEKSALFYLKGYKNNPRSSKASDSLLKLALSLSEINKIKEACSTLSKLETEFPNRPDSSKKRAKDAKAKFGCKDTK